MKYILTEDNLTLPELDEFVCLVEEAGLLKCHFLVSTDFKNEQMSDDMLHSGLYLYCRLLNFHFLEYFNAANPKKLNRSFPR